MKYISTRGEAPAASFSDILLEGLAADGGLYVPVAYPQLDADILASWRDVLANQGYAELAHCVLSLFIDDIDSDDLLKVCRKAYSPEKFDSASIVPVQPIGDGPLWLGHLSNGPTAAFKDMAMQLLGELFSYELQRRDDYLTILGATSGDTGSAAEYAMRGKDRLSVYMLTPAGRMTPFQQAQMFGLDDPNIHNIALDGVFDDCQDIVKAVNGDAEFKTRYHIGAVNSINWARIVAQVVYYVALWLRVTTRDDQRVSFAVPTGNFGNICAGHIAREMGLPIDALILATNENDVLNEFFTTGCYRVRESAEVFATSSPSMDISKASNFERFVFDLIGRDSTRTADLFGRQLVENGCFDLVDTCEFSHIADRYGFVTGSSTHADRVQTIRGTYRDTGILLDPHTADAAHVAHAKMNEVKVPIIVLETALPVKFAETIDEAIHTEVEIPERFAAVMSAPRQVIDMPNDVQAVKEYIAHCEASANR